jgi:hypothetical protein
MALAVAIAGCAAAGGQPMETPAMEKLAMDLSGVWRGEIRVIPCPVGITSSTDGRCNAVNRITFSLRQTDSSLSGEYRCTIGTQVCRDANTTDRGTVTSGQVSGRDISIRVLLPGDLSSCLYNGSQYSADQMRGTYRCYQGGGLAEVGIWQMRRGIGEQSQPFLRPE